MNRGQLHTVIVEGLRTSIGMPDAKRAKHVMRNIELLIRLGKSVDAPGVPPPLAAEEEPRVLQAPVPQQAVVLEEHQQAGEVVRVMPEPVAAPPPPPPAPEIPAATPVTQEEWDAGIDPKDTNRRNKVLREKMLEVARVLASLPATIHVIPDGRTDVITLNRSLDAAGVQEGIRVSYAPTGEEPLLQEIVFVGDAVDIDVLVQVISDKAKKVYAARGPVEGRPEPAPSALRVGGQDDIEAGLGGNV